MHSSVHLLDVEWIKDLLPNRRYRVSVSSEANSSSGVPQEPFHFANFLILPPTPPSHEINWQSFIGADDFKLYAHHEIWDSLAVVS